ncbi:NADPH-dependent oxidoreductase [Lentilactobacillus sp. Marseille-Q4993]|uniref:NADPH-dependent oxidoreductase n=1 Tax=Lentilactobacillus sp. Marseille-Q4993 TaxID=3039492 RepID=UPI0024BC1F52|nr:NADPH-dependent oxidoreductase [Lentilactobacillus sp. Marseille-Q4993]
MENSTLNVINDHRSVRKFTGELLTKDQVDTLIDAATHASTSTFSQQYSIISVTDRDKLEAIAKLTGNKQWILKSGHFFVMVVDQYRNLQLAKTENQDPYILRTFDKFLAGTFDVGIATENIMLAAESMGLGGTVLGSILNDSQQMIDLLGLPELTFPLLGIAVGVPASRPDLKPRMPHPMQHFDNQYQLGKEFEHNLNEYNSQLGSYYQSRNSNQRTETFTSHIVSELARDRTLRSELIQMISKQGFIVD